MIGVRSRYTIQGEAGSIKKDITVYIKQGSDETVYQYAKEVKEGDYLDISPIIRDFFTHKLRVLNVIDVTVQYTDEGFNSTTNIEQEFSFKAADGYLYSDEPENSDLYKHKHILLSSEQLKIGGERFYFFFDAKHQNDKLKIRSYPSGLINKEEIIPIGLHYIELNNYTDEEYIVLTVEDGEEVIIQIEQETKYNTHTVDFLNKYGVWERMFFTKKETGTLNIESSEYRSAGVNEFVKYSINGREKIALNTFWIPEQMNETIRQLMLSEEIYLNDKMYNVDQKTVSYKSRTNDTLISYEIQFINANNLIR